MDPGSAESRPSGMTLIEMASRATTTLPIRQFRSLFPLYSFLHEPAEIVLLGVPAVDYALFIHGDAFRRSDLFGGNGDEGRDLAVGNTADSNSLLESLVVLLIRLGVSHVDRAVLVD